MSGCPRCGEALPADGACRRCAKANLRHGDATRGRIERLADGWALPVRQGAPTDRVLREVHADGTNGGAGATGAPAAGTPESGDPGGRSTAGAASAPTPLARAQGKRARPSPTDRARTTTGPDIGNVLDALENDLARDPEIPTARQALLEPGADAPARGDLTELAPPPLVETEPKAPEPEPEPAARAPRSARPSRPPPVPAPVPVPMSAPRPGPNTQASRPPPSPAQGRSFRAAGHDDPTTVGEASVALATAAPVAIPAPTLTPTPTPRLAERRPGRLGDVGYAFAVVRALVAGRRELKTLAERRLLERSARERRLVDLARHAAADEQIAGDALEAARERLLLLEEQRGKDNADAERAEAEARAADDERAEARREAEATLAELARAHADVIARLRPLEREAAERKKALDQLGAQLHAMQKRIDGIERRLGAARDGGERAAVEAELAPARAERQLLLADEPKRRAAHADLLPELEALAGEAEALLAKEAETRAALAASEARTTAVAKAARERKVRADAACRGNEAARERELVDLAKRLDRERPPALATRFRPVDEHNRALAEAERRIAEIGAARAEVDRLALARGLALIMVVPLVVALVLGLALR